MAKKALNKTKSYHLPANAQAAALILANGSGRYAGLPMEWAPRLWSARHGKEQVCQTNPTITTTRGPGRHRPLALGTRRMSARIALPPGRRSARSTSRTAQGARHGFGSQQRRAEAQARQRHPARQARCRMSLAERKLRAAIYGVEQERNELAQAVFELLDELDVIGLLRQHTPMSRRHRVDGLETALGAHRACRRGPARSGGRDRPPGGFGGRRRRP